MFYYGFDYECIFYPFDNVNEFIDTLDLENQGNIIIELKPTKDKNYPRQCGVDLDIFLDMNGICGKNNCFDYSPRNGKSGICKHNQCGLKPTGKKWEIVNNKNMIREINEIAK